MRISAKTPVSRLSFSNKIIPRTREEILQEPRELKATYGELFNSVAALLFRHDPIGIAFENPHTDEYEPEVGTILPRLKDCESGNDVIRVVHEEFVRWFDPQTAGPKDIYTGIAAEIWELLQRYRNGLGEIP